MESIGLKPRRSLLRKTVIQNYTIFKDSNNYLFVLESTQNANHFDREIKHVIRTSYGCDQKELQIDR
jgi:L-rhamnose mutarotase